MKRAAVEGRVSACDTTNHPCLIDPASSRLVLLISDGACTYQLRLCRGSRTDFENKSCDL